MRNPISCCRCIRGSAVKDEDRDNSKAAPAVATTQDPVLETCDVINPPASAFTPVTPPKEVDCEAAASQVRVVCAAGRPFEAQRLLTECGGQTSLLEADDLAQIQATVSSLGELQQQIAEAKTQAQMSGGGWTCKEMMDSKVWYSYGKRTGKVDVLADMTLDVAPLCLWVMIREFDLAHLWVPNVGESTLQETFFGHCDLYRLVSNPVVPGFSETESFQDRTYCDVLDEWGSMVVIVEAPGLEASTHRGVKLPPPAKGRKRMRQVIRNQMIPLSKQRSCLTLFLKIDTPFYWLPDALVGKIASLLCNKFVHSLSECSKGWETSEFKRRLESGPRAAYYEAIRERIEEKLQREENRDIGIAL